ncbi:MAG: hypothetical protein ABSF83_10785 [Nitrososphaerales archaeon]
MSAGTAAGPAEKKEGETLSLSEILARYKGRWVAMVVVERDANLQPLSGRVVAEDADRYRLREHLSGYADVCILYAGASPYPLLL